MKFTEKEIKEIEMDCLLNEKCYKTEFLRKDPEKFLDACFFLTLLNVDAVYDSEDQVYYLLSNYSIGPVKRYLESGDCFLEKVMPFYDVRANKFRIEQFKSIDFNRYFILENLHPYMPVEERLNFEMNVASKFIKYLQDLKLLKYDEVTDITFEKIKSRNYKDNHFELSVRYHLRNIIYGTEGKLSIRFVLPINPKTFRGYITIDFDCATFFDLEEKFYLHTGNPSFRKFEFDYSYRNEDIGKFKKGKIQIDYDYNASRLKVYLINLAFVKFIVGKKILEECANTKFDYNTLTKEQYERLGKL